MNPLFMITVKVICPCGWLMQQWDVDFLCGNPRCENNGKLFILDARLSQFAMSEKIQ